MSHHPTSRFSRSQRSERPIGFSRSEVSPAIIRAVPAIASQQKRHIRKVTYAKEDKKEQREREANLASKLSQSGDLQSAESTPFSTATTIQLHICAHNLFISSQPVTQDMYLGYICV